jgi:hypothetical protein
LCPVKRECAAEANNDKRNIQGVWGGLTHRERIKPGYRENLKRNPKNRQNRRGPQKSLAGKAAPDPPLSFFPLSGSEVLLTVR